jgi:hypothetical protein
MECLLMKDYFDLNSLFGLKNETNVKNKLFECKDPIDTIGKEIVNTINRIYFALDEVFQGDEAKQNKFISESLSSHILTFEQFLKTTTAITYIDVADPKIDVLEYDSDKFRAALKDLDLKDISPEKEQELSKLTPDIIDINDPEALAPLKENLEELEKFITPLEHPELSLAFKTVYDAATNFEMGDIVESLAYLSATNQALGAAGITIKSMHKELKQLQQKKANKENGRKGGQKRNAKARQDKFVAQCMYKSGKYEGKNAAVRIIMDGNLDYNPRTIDNWLKEINKKSSA